MAVSPAFVGTILQVCAQAMAAQEMPGTAWLRMPGSNRVLVHSPVRAGDRRAPAYPHEVASLMHGRQPKPGTHLLIGIGPYNQVLAVTAVPNRRELGNIIVIAPPRHGKGLHATAELLTWEHSVIVNDIKGEHFDRTGNARSRLGPVFVFDPRGYGNRYDPLKHCTTEDDFLALADQLLAKTGDKEADAFVQRARGMLTA